MKYAAHPYADLFPLMGDLELKQLADDIVANGQREPIYLVGELILDGRNRYRACELAKAKPRFEQYTGDDLLGFVVSKNLHRRHLTESQRAMVAAKLANMKPHDNQYTGKSGPPNLEDHKPLVPVPKAAEMLNVGASNIYKAKQVHRDGVPELAKAVESGEVSLNAAEMVATLPKDEQRELIEQGPGAVKAKATEVRKEKQAMKTTAATKPADEPAPPAAPQSRPVADTENRAKPKKLRGVGVLMANEALNTLHKIPGDDPDLDQAVSIITAWVNRQKGRMPRN